MKLLIEYMKGHKSTREALQAMVQDYLQDNPGTTPGAFGWAVCRDTGFIARLLKGGDVGTERYDALVKYLSEYQANLNK